MSDQMTIEELVTTLAQRDCYLIVRPTHAGRIELVLVSVSVDGDGRRRFAKTTARDPDAAEQAVVSLLDGELDPGFSKMETLRR